jgi:hypothetical protein
MMFSWLVTQVDPGVPSIPDPIRGKVQTVINAALGLCLVGCVLSGAYGAASFGWASKRQNFGGVNDGKKQVTWSLAGAAVLGVLIALVNYAFAP